MEALLGLAKGIGEPAVSLVGLRTPAADAAEFAAAGPEDVLDAVGAQQTGVERRRCLEQTSVWPLPPRQ